MRRTLALLALGVALLLGSDAGARAFVLPHVLERSGTIDDTQFTFDTSFFSTYTGGVQACPPGQPCAFVELYLFDETTGALLEGVSGPVCNPCTYPLGSGDAGSEPAPNQRTILIDDEIVTRGGGFSNPSVVLGFAIALVTGDYDNVNITSTVVNAKTGPLDLAVFGFEPQPILPIGGGLAPLAPGAPLGTERRLDDVREDRGTVATTTGAYDTTISIFYLDAWFGPGAPPTGVELAFFDSGGAPMLDAGSQPYTFSIADLSQLPQPVILDLEEPLFGGTAQGAPGKRGYATVSLTGALPERVDVTSFVRRAATGPTDLDPDGFYEQALAAPEPDAAALAATAALLALGCRRRRRGIR